MGRTPLFHLLQRALRVACASTQAGMPPDEAFDRAREGRVDHARRRLLQAGGAGMVLAGCAPLARRDATDAEVVVVGAGIAGLAAAWRLRQRGVPVRVFEAQARIGGRMFSLRDHFPDAQVVELGGELIDSGHVRIRALAAELGLALDDLLDGDRDADTWFFDGRRIGERELVEAFVPLAAAIEREVATLGEGSLDVDDANPAFRALDALSLAQWFDRQGVSGWLRRLLEVAYTTEMGLEPEAQSALNLLTFIGTQGDAFRAFGESDERFHVRGGNDRIPHALGARLADGLHTAHVLEAVRMRGDGYVLSFRDGAATRDVVARQVILALPFTLLREVRLDVALPTAQRRAIDTLAYGTNAKLMVGFDRRPWRAQGANGAAMSDLPFQTTWDTSRRQPGAGGVLTNFTGGRHGIALGQDTAREQALRVATQLDQVFPGTAAARIDREARFHWPSHPWTRGSYACFRPGDWATLRGAIGRSSGGLHFAGEHCALDTQGFMEGGCASGEAAAAAVLHQRGIALARPRLRRVS